MLETFIALNEKDIEKAKGKVEPMVPRGERVGGPERKTYLFILFFFKSREMLWLPPKKRLFKVFSLTITSK